MYLSSTSQGWFQAIGGWSNLLQGLLSAAVTGLVAALVSFAVVKLTNDAARKLSRQQEARDKLADAIESAIDTFLEVPDKRPYRTDLEAAANLSLRLEFAATLVFREDQKTGQLIMNVANQLADTANSWRTRTDIQEDSDAPKRYDEAYKIVQDLPRVMIDWLGKS